MTDTQTGMQVMQTIDTYKGMQPHVIGLEYSAEVILEEGTCNSNDKHYGFRARIESRSDLFVQTGCPKENV